MESWTKEHEMRGNSLPLIVLFQDIKAISLLFMGYIKRLDCITYYNVQDVKTGWVHRPFLYTLKTETGKCGGLEKYGRAAQREREGRVQQHNTIIL